MQSQVETQSQVDLVLMNSTASSPLSETHTKLSSKANPFRPSISSSSTSLGFDARGSYASTSSDSPLDSSPGSVASWTNGQFFMAVPMMAVPMQAGEGGFKLGDFRSKLLRRAHTQAAQEIPLPSVDATINLEKLVIEQPPKVKPLSECKGSQPEALKAPHAAREKSQPPERRRESKGVPAVPSQHAAAFKEQTPSKPDSTEADAFPVRRTFIHFSERDGPEDAGLQWSSAPAIMLNSEHHTKYPGMEAAHIRGECQPCYYNLRKSDGCRNGADCEFCHLCPAGSVQKKRKEKLKANRRQDLFDKHVLQATATAVREESRRRSH